MAPEGLSAFCFLGTIVSSVVQTPDLLFSRLVLLMNSCKWPLEYLIVVCSHRGRCSFSFLLSPWSNRLYFCFYLCFVPAVLLPGSFSRKSRFDLAVHLKINSSKTRLAFAYSIKSKFLSLASKAFYNLFMHFLLCFYSCRNGDVFACLYSAYV